MPDSISYNELKKTFPEEKKGVESIYGRLVPVRKVSYLISIPFLKLKVSAFTVSIISILVAITASVFICLPNHVFRLIGVFFVPLWHVLDCVDGNIARFTDSTSDFGEAVDAISGYYMFSLLPFSLGVSAYNTGFSFFGLDTSLIIIIGALGSISNVLLRLIHQKYAYTGAIFEMKTGNYIEKGDHQYSLTGLNKIRKIVDVEFGPVGIPMFVLFFCPFFNLFGYLALYYGIYYFFSLVIGTVYYLYLCKNN